MVLNATVLKIAIEEKSSEPLGVATQLPTVPVSEIVIAIRVRSEDCGGHYLYRLSHQATVGLVLDFDYDGLQHVVIGGCRVHQVIWVSRDDCRRAES